jgi:DNA-directed RNA polymerase subunit beta'
MKLPEPFPNPLFEKSIQSLVGITGKDFNEVMSGKKGIDPKTGKLTTDLDNSLVGGKAISHALGKIDVDKTLAAAQEQLKNPGLKGNRLDQVNKKVKYLKALKKAGLGPKDAYTMTTVPVLPPSMRPISARPNGDLNTDDLNHMYKGISLSAQQLKNANKLLPEEEKAEIRESVYDGLRSLTGLGGTLNRDHRGVLDIIGGKRPEVSGGRGTGKKIGSPKTGYFQKKLVHRKQDLSMRSTIIPEPDMGLDEVGLPRKAALELYKPFVAKELRGLTGATPLQAQKMIKEGGEQVNRALERVVEERPVLLKRDPVLHKHGIQAFKPRIVGGKAVKIHPLVTSGYNADFDGDAMAAFVPVSPDAVKEAHKMKPSNNLFNPSTGDIMYSPTLESQLGLYGISKVDRKTNKSYKNMKELESGLRKGEVSYNDQVKVGGLSSGAGRFMVAGALPEDMRRDFLKSRAPLDGKAQKQLLTTLAKGHKDDYGNAVNKLKDLGNEWATNTAFSLGMDDIKPEKAARGAALAKADREAAQDRSKNQTKAVQAYDKATQELHRKLDSLPEGSSNLVTMNRAGIKPYKDTLRQIKMAPMLISNAKGEVIKSPVRRSYSEGLDVADYWTSMSGARKGIIQKVQSVQEPGYISKQVMNSVMDNTVVNEDCGTDRGISLPLDEKDVLDRHLAADTRAGRKVFKAGTLLTPDIRNSLRNNKVSRVQVRSPLKCNHGPGVCKKCYGLNEEGLLPEVGANVGIQAGQAIGERATQLAMKAFHTGGTAATKTQLVDDFSRVKDMLRFPATLKGAATLSATSGKVDRIQKDPAGGHNVFVGGQRHYVPQSRGTPMYGGRVLRKGMQVRKGLPISAGPVNPHQMLPLTGIDPVQNHLASELHGVYGKEGIRRRHSEMVVKSLTNLTKIDDPGEHGQFIRGDFAPTSLVSNLNRKYKGVKPIRHQPILKGVDVLPMEMQEDWIAKLNHQDLKRTVLDASQQGWTSKLHGRHPIPPVVFGAEFGKGKPGEY